MKKCKTLQR